MDKYIISGIQQIGIGVENFSEAWKHYIDVFNMDVRILEDDTIAELMLPYTGNSPQKRHACIAVNMQGGGGFEIWQYSERKPKTIDFDIQLGDYGVIAAKIKSKNPELSFQEFSNKKDIQIIGGLNTGIDGNKTFFIKDKFGNLFQIVYDNYIFRNEKRSTGGIVGGVIGVSDIDKAIVVYRDILGYDKIIADKTGIFDELKDLNSGNQKFRRVLLTHSKERNGPFSKLFGQSYIELIQALERTPRKIYENRYWGDPGFIQICFDVKNIPSLKKKCESLGFPFTVDSSINPNNSETFDMGEAAGQFTYIEDPDGTLIELVEAHKIPILKKFGIYLNLRKRSPEKSLPTWMLKALRFGRVKKEEL